MLANFLHIDDGHTLTIAATVGIPLEDWISLQTETATADACLQLMHTHQLDLIPLIATNGQAYEYYSIPSGSDQPTRQVIRFSFTIPSNCRMMPPINLLNTC